MIRKKTWLSEDPKYDKFVTKPNRSRSKKKKTNTEHGPTLERKKKKILLSEDDKYDKVLTKLTRSVQKEKRKTNTEHGPALGRKRKKSLVSEDIKCDTFLTKLTRSVPKRKRKKKRGSALGRKKKKTWLPEDAKYDKFLTKLTRSTAKNKMKTNRGPPLSADGQLPEGMQIVAPPSGDVDPADCGSYPVAEIREARCCLLRTVLSAHGTWWNTLKRKLGILPSGERLESRTENTTDRTGAWIPEDIPFSDWCAPLTLIRDDGIHIRGRSSSVSQPGYLDNTHSNTAGPGEELTKQMTARKGQRTETNSHQCAHRVGRDSGCPFVSDFSGKFSQDDASPGDLRSLLSNRKRKTESFQVAKTGDREYDSAVKCRVVLNTKCTAQHWPDTDRTARSDSSVSFVSSLDTDFS